MASLLFRDVLLGGHGEVPTASALADKSYVGIFFAAHCESGVGCLRRWVGGLPSDVSGDMSAAAWQGASCVLSSHRSWQNGTARMPRASASAWCSCRSIATSPASMSASRLLLPRSKCCPTRHLLVQALSMCVDCTDTLRRCHGWPCRTCTES
jgi:hypothetical protein